jgi:hypothetical protein
VLSSLKQLLASIVDYAGLFPPAQLSLPEAVIQCDQAQVSPHSWILARFVVPATRLLELNQLLSRTSESEGASESRYISEPWSLSAILSRNWAVELEQIKQMHKIEYQHEHQRQCQVEALEVAPLPAAEIQQLCLKLPSDMAVFFEIPFSADLAPYLPVLQQTGTAAKLRTGGITPGAFPDSTQLSQRILSLADAQIPFKATAGLHHALYGTYRLTDALDSPSTAMPGFLNLALLAAFAHQQRLTLTEAVALLKEQSITPFQFTDTAITWRNHSLSIAEIAQSRQHFFRSFGSCSFQQPIDDLYSLGFL